MSANEFKKEINDYMETGDEGHLKNLAGFIAEGIIKNDYDVLDKIKSEIAQVMRSDDAWEKETDKVMKLSGYETVISHYQICQTRQKIKNQKT